MMTTNEQLNNLRRNCEEDNGLGRLLDITSANNIVDRTEATDGLSNDIIFNLKDDKGNWIDKQAKADGVEEAKDLAYIENSERDWFYYADDPRKVINQEDVDKIKEHY